MLLSRSLSSPSLVNPIVVAGDVATTAMAEDTPTGKEEGDRVQSSFKFAAFSTLEERVAGDSQSLQSLARLQAHWSARYGGGVASSMSTTVETMVATSTPNGQSVACGSLSSPRVLHAANYNLPPPMALLQDENSEKGAPLNPMNDQPSTEKGSSGGTQTSSTGIDE
ncbi:hypothetical protein Salat_0628900 [Sesamum alatum]|uniref:Uncharacterized protein n=1 Tax=Sesamum alatum TaxID=300844 RepID=A0AAE2CU46_9LAMI|nr:hypothetical protein Salat_0628900 [Sesamum alatum]